MTQQIRIRISTRAGEQKYIGVHEIGTVAQELLTAGWVMPRGFTDLIRQAKSNGTHDNAIAIGRAVYRIHLGLIGEKLTTRNAGTVRSTLTKLAGTRNPVVERPESMRGEMAIGERVYHWWAASPTPGEHWCVDVEARKYVKIREGNPKYGTVNQLVTS